MIAEEFSGRRSTVVPDRLRDDSIVECAEHCLDQLKWKHDGDRPSCILEHPDVVRDPVALGSGFRSIGNLSWLVNAAFKLAQRIAPHFAVHDKVVYLGSITARVTFGA